MISVCHKQDLENCLAQSIVSCRLREILAKAGIPESEPIKLSIKCVDTDMDVITDYEIPTTIPPVPVAATETDFDQEIKNFLDQAETDHGLLSALSKSDPLPDGTTNRTFDVTFESSCQTSNVMVTGCCITTGNPPHCRVCS